MSWLEEPSFTTLRRALEELLEPASDTSGTDHRIARFCAAFPQDDRHRWTRDLAAELLHNLEPERYPRTRTGNAVSLRARWFLPYRAAIQGDYRFYTDTWDILAHTAEVSYTHPLDEEWTFDVRYRFYTQDAAEFYSDLFPRADFQNFLARDKELSTMTSHTLGFGVAYEFKSPAISFLKRSSLNLRYDRMRFEYDDFRDLRATGLAPGTEPLYDFSANVVQLFFSGWF